MTVLLRLCNTPQCVADAPSQRRQCKLEETHQYAFQTAMYYM